LKSRSVVSRSRAHCWRTRISLRLIPCWAGLLGPTLRWGDPRSTGRLNGSWTATLRRILVPIRSSTPPAKCWLSRLLTWWLPRLSIRWIRCWLNGSSTHWSGRGCRTGSSGRRDRRWSRSRLAGRHGRHSRCRPWRVRPNHSWIRMAWSRSESGRSIRSRIALILLLILIGIVGRAVGCRAWSRTWTRTGTLLLRLGSQSGRRLSQRRGRDGQRSGR